MQAEGTEIAAAGHSSSGAPLELRAATKPLTKAGLLRGLGIKAWLKDEGSESNQHIVPLQIFQAHMEQCIAFVLICFMHQAGAITCARQGELPLMAACFVCSSTTSQLHFCCLQILRMIGVV